MEKNRYQLSDEVKEKFIPIIQMYIDKVEVNDSENGITQGIDLSDMELNPYTLQELLKEMGYEEVNTDTNGWQCDFWIEMKKRDFKSLSITGCGMTFELKLSEYEE